MSLIFVYADHEEVKTEIHNGWLLGERRTVKKSRGKLVNTETHK